MKELTHKKTRKRKKNEKGDVNSVLVNLLQVSVKQCADIQLFHIKISVPREKVETGKDAFLGRSRKLYGRKILDFLKTQKKYTETGRSSHETQ